MLKLPLTATLLSLTLYTGATAAVADKRPVYPASLVNELRPGNELADYLNIIPRLLERFDRDDNGLDARDIALSEQKAQAQIRANAASQFLRMDLDGDNKVTRQEVSDTSAQRQHSTQALIDNQVRRAMRDDKNGDGVLTLSEALASAEAHGCRRPTADFGEQLLALDPGKNGHLTSAELSTIATGLFKTYDSNSDGVISTKEYETGRTLVHIATFTPPTNPDCLMR
ncbi:MAG: hypothetical protein Q7T44_18125 [Parvibaculum sp.]|nr:hypothetical protein [Parvibaculum sp.]